MNFGPLDQTWTVVRYVDSLTVVIVDMIAGTGSLAAVIFLQCKAIDSITTFHKGFVYEHPAAQVNFSLNKLRIGLVVHNRTLPPLCSNELPLTLQPPLEKDDNSPEGQ
jgi:hypothetical protein